MKILATALALVLPMTAVAATAFDIASIAGSYRTSFPNADVQGEEWTGHNTLKIAKLSRSEAKVEIYLQYYNGHECEFDGTMTLEGRKLVYREQMLHDDLCTLTVERVGNSVVVGGDENHACKRSYCGSNASFDEEFPMKIRKH